MGQKLLPKAKILSSKNGSHFVKEVTKVDLVSEKNMEVYSYTLNLSVNVFDFRNDSYHRAKHSKRPLRDFMTSLISTTFPKTYLIHVRWLLSRHSRGFSYWQIPQIINMGRVLACFTDQISLYSQHHKTRKV